MILLQNAANFVEEFPSSPQTTNHIKHNSHSYTKFTHNHTQKATPKKKQNHARNISCLIDE
jgi:hypothetical protein